jgi:hypothetical protein
MKLHDKAMLVDLSITMWSMRKYDKKISKQVEEQHNAFDAGRYNKVLIAVEQGKLITQKQGEARTFHYKNTLPWEDNGKRILTTPNYKNYMTEMGRYRSAFMDAVHRFLQNYDYYKSEAKRRLNGMYNEADYPDINDLRNRFDFNVYVSPVPHQDDFRIDLGQFEMERVQKEVEERLASAQEAASKELWKRLYDAIQHIIERLSKDNAMFHDSLIGNVIELTDLLPRLNFMNDQNLDDMRKEIEATLCTLSPDNLRSDARLRSDAKNKATEIADKMKGFM